MGGSGAASKGMDADATPLRAELFSVEQMVQHGRALAEAHVVDKGGPRISLLRRLDDNERVLIETCTLLTEASASRLRVAPPSRSQAKAVYGIPRQTYTQQSVQSLTRMI